ncbi:hypothetical protein Nepgr_016481 [Nepenthes gracilis]|uniref:Uncharacterized protein n=1 Tax=Nepenthes gracilis TaxID=150966 RepID=A0AAD3XSJ3_NEPGR|nr:hypothetical protein Nepgr_016481 [Nepenthes gracilis]
MKQNPILPRNGQGKMHRHSRKQNSPAMTSNSISIYPGYSATRNTCKESTVKPHQHAEEPTSSMPITKHTQNRKTQPQYQTAPNLDRLKSQ